MLARPRDGSGAPQAARDDFTERDERAALKKLTAASLVYKQQGARSLGPAGFAGFRGSAMPPAILREQLKHTFGLVFTKRELGALFAVLAREAGADDADTIDGKEFLRFFHVLGTKAQKRAAQRARQKAEWDALVKEAAAARRAEEAEIEAAVGGGVGAFHPDDLATAYFCRVGYYSFDRGDAAAAARIVRGDGCRGDAAAATWTFRGDEFAWQRRGQRRGDSAETGARRPRYDKLGRAAVAPGRSAPNVRPFREGGALKPRQFAKEVRRTFGVDLTEREVSAVATSLQDDSIDERGRDQDKYGRVDGERFLRRVHQMNAMAVRAPRVERTPVVGDWTRRRRFDAAPIRSYSNGTLAEPVRRTEKFTAFDPCGCPYRGPVD